MNHEDISYAATKDANERATETLHDSAKLEDALEEFARTCTRPVAKCLVHCFSNLEAANYSQHARDGILNALNECYLVMRKTVADDVYDDCYDLEYRYAAQQERELHRRLG